MLQPMKRVQAHYSDISSQRSTKGRIKRKTTATSIRRANVASEEDGSGSHGEDCASKDTLISFEKVLSGGSIHTAECCRLSLPRAFCERYDVGGALTATDSAGTRLWHMRFQSCARARHPVFTISNGWREFSYDHGLKVSDRVVFTLLSPSHFRVEYAASSRRMFATRDEEKYPWRINYARLDCLTSSVTASSQEKAIRIKNGVSVASDESEEIRQRSVAPISLQENEQGVEETRRSSVAPITLYEDEQGVIRIRVKDDEVIRKDMAEHVHGLIQIRVADEDARLKSEAAAAAAAEGVQGLLRKNIAIADHQQLQKMEMFCQCDMAMARKGAVKSKYVVPKLTHLECKNADGSSYLQIVDSDSEMSNY